MLGDLRVGNFRIQLLAKYFVPMSPTFSSENKGLEGWHELVRVIF
jgi:hypothetical protein